MNLHAQENTSIRNKLNSFALALATVAACVIGQSAEAQDLYISLEGDNSDGLTLKTAWKEMNQLKNVRSGDNIRINAGTYHTGLTISTNNVTVTPLASNGLVVIDGQHSLATGIKLANPQHVVINGLAKSGIKVQNCTTYGMDVGGNFNIVTLVELNNNGKANFHSSGDQIVLDFALVHDSGGSTNVLVDNASPRVSRGLASLLADFNLEDSCVYQSQYASSGIDGVDVTNTVPFCNISNCAIGPCLQNGVSNTSSGTELAVCQGLLLNAAKANVFSVKQMILTSSTLFDAHFNPSNKAHTTLQAPYIVETNDILYGGTITVSNHLQTSPIKNDQFQTTGSTTQIVGTNTDPKFTTNVSSLYSSNPTAAQLMSADFTSHLGKYPAPTGGSMSSSSINSFQARVNAMTAANAKANISLDKTYYGY